jgi:hypothetical protein
VEVREVLRPGVPGGFHSTSGYAQKFGGNVASFGTRGAQPASKLVVPGRGHGAKPEKALYHLSRSFNPQGYTEESRWRESLRTPTAETLL